MHDSDSAAHAAAAHAAAAADSAAHAFVAAERDWQTGRLAGLLGIEADR